jgi:hypothetical protein
MTGSERARAVRSTRDTSVLLLAENDGLTMRLIGYEPALRKLWDSSVIFISVYEEQHIIITRGVKLTTRLYLVPSSENAWNYTSTPPILLRGVVLS